MMIELPVETVSAIVTFLNLGLNADDGNPFGIWHNDVTDLVGSLELMLEESKAHNHEKTFQSWPTRKV